MTRPGPTLSEAEVLAAILGDVEDGLESFQVPQPYPGIENILDQVKFVRRRLIGQIPPEVDHGQEVAQ